MKKVGGRYIVTDYQEEQVAPSESETMLLNVCTQDSVIAVAQGAEYRVRWGKGKGDAGERDSPRLVAMLDGLDDGGGG